jgi:hypothetical protein
MRKLTVMPIMKYKTIKTRSNYMGREEARAKGWETWRENMIQRAKEHPEFSLNDFILQRAYGAYTFWRDARTAERRWDYERARGLYLKAVESLEQAEKLIEHPVAAEYAKRLKSEYYDFVVHRYPAYRINLKYLLPLIKAEPGILQTQTYKQLHLSRPEITYTLYFAEKEGLIRREKKGRSYQLFFAREKPANEPLLKIQDDEIDIQSAAEQETRAREGCLFILSFVFWGFAFVGLGAVAGLPGAGFVIVAFIVWRIIKKVHKKKKKVATSTQTYSQPALQVLPDNSDKNSA